MQGGGPAALQVQMSTMAVDAMVKPKSTTGKKMGLTIDIEQIEQ